jgi:hypothetical protein
MAKKPCRLLTEGHAKIDRLNLPKMLFGIGIALGNDSLGPSFAFPASSSFRDQMLDRYERSCMPALPFLERLGELLEALYLKTPDKPSPTVSTAGRRAPYERSLPTPLSLASY